MSLFNEQLNGWLKALIPATILAVGGLIGYGQLKERVDTTKFKAEKLEAIVMDTAKEQAVTRQMLLDIKELLKEIKDEQKEFRKQMERRTR